MKFIGITGGIGAGKSEILKYIHDHYKCRIYLADKVAFEVRRPGTACYEKLVELLGKETVSDSKLMAAKLFGNDELLRQVNNIIHPAVKEFLLSELEKAKNDPEIELFFVEAALLIECGYGELVDEMWYVYASRETRIKRLMTARGYSLKKAESIMDNQLSDEDFRNNSDFIINNDGRLIDAVTQIRSRLEANTWLK